MTGEPAVKVRCLTLNLPGGGDREVSTTGRTGHVEGSIPGSSTGVQQSLSIEDSPNKRHLSNEDTVCCRNHLYRAVHKSTSEVRTPLL